MPHEMSLFGILFSPWLVAGAGGGLMALATAAFLNVTDASRFFRMHQWTFLCLMVLYACMIFYWGLE